jgi:hypothetical protein
MAPIIGYQGRTLRQPNQQAALAVRLLDGRHRDDVIATMRTMLGDRAKVLGPPDMTRNPLRVTVDRLATAFGCPSPLVTGLGEELDGLLGGGAARPTIDRYAAAGGRPMPPQLSESMRIAQRYWIGACWAGLYVRWLPRHRRIYVEPVPPDQLDVVYSSDDPLEPIIVRRIAYRHPQSGSGLTSTVETWDEWDLTDPDRPVYTVRGPREGGVWGPAAIFGAPSLEVATLSGSAYPWRYSDGRPYCPVVIVGDPARPYGTDTLIEATLRVSTLWSHWSAAVTDAGHPQRSVIGLRLVGMSSSMATEAAGIATGPETVLQWEHTNPDLPGTLHQWGPGFDPEILGRAVRDYEAAAMQLLGIPTSMEQTGGAPTDLEQERLDRAVEAGYPRCRWAVVEVLRRAAAIASAQDGVGAIPDDGYSALFGSEIDEALASAGAGDTEDEEIPDGSAGSDGAEDGPGDRGVSDPEVEDAPEDDG